MSPKWSKHAIVALACLAAAPSASAQAQGWHLDIEIAASRMAGGARDAVVNDGVMIRPNRPVTYGVRLQRLRERVGYGLAVRYSRPGLAFDGPEASIVDHANSIRLIEIAPEVSLRIAGQGSGPGLRARVGPVVDVWSWELTDTYTRLGARGGLGVDLPVGRRVAITVGGAATLTGSMFSEADVGPEFETKRAVRTEVGIGLRYALR